MAAGNARGRKRPAARSRAGQAHQEAGAVPWARLDGQHSAVPVDDVAHDGQAEPRAVSGWLGGEEGLEDSIQIFVLDAHAVVTDERDGPALLLAGADRHAVSALGCSVG